MYAYSSKMSISDWLEICFGCVAFLGAIVLAFYLWMQESRKSSWVKGTGEIMMVTVKAHDNHMTFSLNRQRHSIDYSYTYNVHGKTFSGRWSQDIPERSSDWKCGQYKYDPPQSTVVFYNPSAPEESTLEKHSRYDGLGWFCLILVPIFYLLPLIQKWQATRKRRTQ